jgi:hypothetical protein
MADLSTILRRYKKDLMKVAASTCEEMASNTARRTPVDTGAARKSWTPDRNKVNLSNSGGNPGHVASRLRPGDTFTYTSSLPYIRVLEYQGHSAQAPSGMMRLAIAEFKINVDRHSRSF